MFSMDITDIAGFMNHLLGKDTFDQFLTIEAAVRMGVTYRIDGRWNKDFFDTEDVPAAEYCPWKEIRPRIYQVVRGHRLPSSMKIILTLPEAEVRRLLDGLGETGSPEIISGIHLNILYSPRGLRISSGIAGHSFLLDRRPEQLADEALKNFLKKRGIC